MDKLAAEYAWYCIYCKHALSNGGLAIACPLCNQGKRFVDVNLYNYFASKDSLCENCMHRPTCKDSISGEMEVFMKLDDPRCNASNGFWFFEPHDRAIHEFTYKYKHVEPDRELDPAKMPVVETKPDVEMTINKKINEFKVEYDRKMLRVFSTFMEIYFCPSCDQWLVSEATCCPSCNTKWAIKTNKTRRLRILFFGMLYASIYLMMQLGWINYIAPMTSISLTDIEQIVLYVFLVHCIPGVVADLASVIIVEIILSKHGMKYLTIKQYKEREFKKQEKIIKLEREIAWIKNE